MARGTAETSHAAIAMEGGGIEILTIDAGVAAEAVTEMERTGSDAATEVAVAVVSIGIADHGVVRGPLGKGGTIGTGGMTGMGGMMKGREENEAASAEDRDIGVKGPDTAAAQSHPTAGTPIVRKVHSGDIFYRQH